MLEERAAPGRADTLQRVEDRLARLRVAALAVEAEREAMRLVADPLEELKSRRVPVEPIGSGRSGTKTSSSRLASEITATRGRSNACIAASTAES